MPDIKKFVERMRYWCDEGNLGYCQEHRWDIREGGEADCSSLVIHCLREAGFNTGNASYTGNMSENLCSRGWERVPNNGYLRFGDILLNDSHHVAVYVGNGLLSQASRNEKHTANGGKPGDQDNYETNTRRYYDYPWNCYLRYANSSNEMPNEKLDEDGIWGVATTRALQKLFETYVDGIVSGQWSPDAYRHKGCPSFVHDNQGEGSPLIRAMQKYLNERGYGLSVDGLCGPATINALIAYFKPLSGATEYDGRLDFPSITVKAMQRSLNAGKF